MQLSNACLITFIKHPIWRVKLRVLRRAKYILNIVAIDADWLAYGKLNICLCTLRHVNNHSQHFNYTLNFSSRTNFMGNFSPLSPPLSTPLVPPDIIYRNVVDGTSLAIELFLSQRIFTYKTRILHSETTIRITRVFFYGTSLKYYGCKSTMSGGNGTGIWASGSKYQSEHDRGSTVGNNLHNVGLFGKCDG